MKATTKEQAEKAWHEKADDYFIRSIILSAGAYNQGISDFKSALRAEIEYEISQLTPSSDVASGKRSGLRKALDLIETTLPPKE